MSEDDLKRTPLDAFHARHGARMTGFAGWRMPVQYAAGPLKEHASAREGAALFDVGHMGQVNLRPRSGRIEDAMLALERLTPAAVLGLPDGRQRYAVLTNDAGGIEDDLMVSNRGDRLALVVNAANAEADVALLRRLEDVCEVEPLGRGLIALQGPGAESVLTTLGAAAGGLRFMDAASLTVAGVAVEATRSGYTGEDGFELSVAAEHAPALAEALVEAGAAPGGLAARDTLRLEAGLPLHGSDIDAGTSPVEAGLTFAIQKARRAGGEREGGFPGAERILRELVDGPDRIRVGLRPEGRAPFRAHVPLFEAEDASAPVGEVSSGTFGASAGGPVAMAYLPPRLAAPSTPLWGEVRGKRLAAAVHALPFVPHRYKR
ncbi:MAG: glycine cleavage system aminomethyltransferase GcvT [Pseudomonadota bacterium]